MTQFRPVNMNWAKASLREGDNNTVYLTNSEPLPEYHRALFDQFDVWAEKTPDVTAIAERNSDNGWRRVTYKELKDQSRAIGQYLINKGVSAQNGLAIISPNSIDHALMALGAMRAGIPYAPITPAYALLSTDFKKLSYVLNLMKPSMIYVDDTEPFKQAIQASAPQDCFVTAANHADSGFSLKEALATTPSSEIEQAERNVNADTIAKLLFTSGSTGMPKAVINTQKMLCSNQVMIRESLAFLKDEPPVLVDWLPWNHTAGGNHNFGLCLYNGGTFYIDNGKPTPSFIAKSIHNLNEVSPTVYFNVPKGFELLVAEMEKDEHLKNNFFANLKLIQYSGAGLSAHIFKRLSELAIESVGHEITVITGYGATETAPFATSPIGPMKQTGTIGLPAKGVEFKLVNQGVKTELRLRGPSITPGYWGETEKTKEAFDDEGFYCIKDAVKFVDSDEASKGLRYDGRLAEDFKLSTGTWVNFANLRNGLIAAAAPIIREVVLTGHDADFIGALLFLDVEQARNVDTSLSGLNEAELAKNPLIQNYVQQAMNRFLAQSTGSSTRIKKAIIMEEAASLQTGEMTDKGSVNQGAVLKRRKALVDSVYSDSESSEIIVAKNSTTMH